MHYLNMLAICLEGQMLNTKIQVRYPPHLDVFMLQLNQWLESPKVTYCELGGLITIHHVDVTLTYLNNYHHITHIDIPRLRKFNEGMDKFQQWQDASKPKQNLKVTQVFIIQLGLLISKTIQSHLHQQSFVFCHHSFGKAQHRNPFGFHIQKDFISLFLHEICTFCELQVLFRWVGKIWMWGL